MILLWGDSQLTRELLIQPFVLQEILPGMLPPSPPLDVSELSELGATVAPLSAETAATVAAWLRGFGAAGLRPFPDALLRDLYSILSVDELLLGFFTLGSDAEANLLGSFARGINCGLYVTPAEEMQVKEDYGGRRHFRLANVRRSRARDDWRLFARTDANGRVQVGSSSSEILRMVDRDQPPFFGRR